MPTRPRSASTCPIAASHENDHLAVRRRILPDHFPPTERALDDPAGLLAAGGDLSTARLLAAYQRGIFPWYSAGSAGAVVVA